MKSDIHPKYVTCEVKCACGHTFKTLSNRPEIHVGICANCHPFFTGQQKFVDHEGRLERFQRRYAKKG